MSHQHLKQLPQTKARAHAHNAHPAGRTQDHSVFSFLPGDQPCQGLDTVVQRYRDLVPQVGWGLV